MEYDIRLAAELSSSIEKCLHHLHLLKNLVLGAHDIFAGKIIEFTNNADASGSLDRMRELIENYALQITVEYEKLEAEAKALPVQTPGLLMVNKLNHYLLDCSTNLEIMSTYSKTKSVFDWSENATSYINVVYELFKISNMNSLTQQRHKRLTLAHQFNALNEPQPHLTIPQEMTTFSQHKKFENMFLDFVQSQKFAVTKDQAYPYKLGHTFLEHSALSSIIEVRFLSIPRVNYRTVDGQLTCLLKMLMLVNGGAVEYIQFMAPHEDWRYTEVPGINNRKQVDIGVQSRYELYQRITVHGNVYVNIMSNMLTTSTRMLTIFFSNLSRFFLIDQPCLRCHKRLRDFSPVTCGDQNRTPYHLACK